MKKRITAGFLLLCLLVLSVQASVFAEAPEQDSYEAWIWEPYVEKDDTLSTGLVTHWSCITFGSYPQTEIVASSFTAVDDYAVQEGDVLEDPDLYEKLAGAEWQDNRTEIDGIRYLRENRRDTASGSTERAQHYRWDGDSEWHYFRFDPIRWRIIGLEGNAACLLADRLMDCRPFHTENGPVTWENSSIRSWLNSYPAEKNSAGIDYRGKKGCSRNWCPGSSWNPANESKTQITAACRSMKGDSDEIQKICPFTRVIHRCPCDGSGSKCFS